MRLSEEEKTKIIELLPYHGIGHISQEINRSRKTVGLFVQSLPETIRETRRPFGQRWAKEEVAYLKRNYGRYSMTTLAKSLTRSERALEDKAYRLGLPSLSELAHRKRAFKVAQVAALFNGDEDRIAVCRFDRFVRKGLLTAFKVGNRRGIYFIEEAEVYRFIREHPDKYCLYDMPVSRYKVYAENYWKHRSLPDMTVKELAAKANVSSRYVVRLVQQEKIPAYKKPGYGDTNFIRREDAEEWLRQRVKT